MFVYINSAQQAAASQLAACSTHQTVVDWRPWCLDAWGEKHLIFVAILTRKYIKIHVNNLLISLPILSCNVSPSVTSIVGVLCVYCAVFCRLPLCIIDRHFWWVMRCSLPCYDAIALSLCWSLCIENNCCFIEYTLHKTPFHCLESDTVVREVQSTRSSAVLTRESRPYSLR